MTAGKTYTPISTTTLSSASPSITFSSIPGTYTDLKIVFSGRGTAADSLELPTMRFNGDTGSNYSRTVMYGDGTTAYSARSSNKTSIELEYVSGGNAASGTFGLIIVDLLSYASTSVYKTSLVRTNEASATVRAQVNLWRVADAITSISIAPSFAANWAVGTSATLYGIAAA